MYALVIYITPIRAACRGAAPIALHLTCAGFTHNQGKGMDQKWDTKFSANICAINFKQDQIVALLKPDLHAYAEMIAFRFCEE